MKRLIALILCAGMFLLCGCAETKPEIEPPVDESGAEQAGPEPSTEPSTEPADDGEVTEKTFDFGEGLTEDGFFDGIRALDCVTLPDLDAIEIPEDCVTPNREEVEYQIENSVLVNYGEPDYEKTVEDGDTVNIDYVGSVDGVEFAGGSTNGEGTDVTIGVTNYIEGFLPQLIGHKPGENFDIDVTFPEDYGNTDLAGAAAVFNITINYVKKAPTTVTDEMAADFGFDSAEALTADVEDWVLNQYRSRFFSELVASAEYGDIPESLTSYMEDYIVKEYEMNYGYDLSGEREEFISYYEANVATIESMVKEAIFALALCEERGVTVADEDVVTYGMASYLDRYGAPFVKNQLMIYRLAPDFVFARLETE